MRTITIEKNDAGQRLDKFMAKRFRSMPKSLLYKYIRTKYIKLNGKKCLPDTVLAPGDVITLYIKDEFFTPVRKAYDFLKAPAKLNIVYEDQNLLLLDKKPGLIVHPDQSYHLIRWLRGFGIISTIKANTTRKRKTVFPQRL